MATLENRGAGADASGGEGRRSEKSASAFRTISEVARELGVPQHVLRFWETKFTQIRPLKRGGGRRYYRPEDVELLRSIRSLLYDDGYTIRGVQKLLRESGVRGLTAREPEPGQNEAPQTEADPEPASDAASMRQAALREILDELYAIRALLAGKSS